MLLLMLASFVCGFFALKYFLLFCRTYLEGVPAKARVVGYRGGHAALPVIQADLGANETVTFTLDRTLPAYFMPESDGQLKNISFSPFNPSQSLVDCYTWNFKVNYIYALAFHISSQYFFKAATKFEYVIGTGTFVIYIMCGCAVYYLFRLFKKRRIPLAAIREKISQHERDAERTHGPASPLTDDSAIIDGNDVWLFKFYGFVIFSFLALFCLPLMNDEKMNVQAARHHSETVQATVAGFEWAVPQMRFDYLGLHRYRMILTASDGTRLVVASHPENLAYKAGDRVAVTRIPGSDSAFIRRPPQYIEMGFVAWRQLSLVFLTLAAGSFLRILMQAVMLLKMSGRSFLRRTSASDI